MDRSLVLLPPIPRRTGENQLKFVYFQCNKTESHTGIDGDAPKYMAVLMSTFS